MNDIDIPAEAIDAARSALAGRRTSLWSDEAHRGRDRRARGRRAAHPRRRARAHPGWRSRRGDRAPATPALASASVRAIEVVKLSKLRAVIGGES